MSDSLLPAWCRIVREVTPELVDAIASRTPVRSPAAAEAVIIPRLGQEDVEVVVVMMLDAQPS